MDIGLHDSAVDAKFLAILQPQIHRRLHDQFIDGLERLGSKAIKGTVEGVMFGYRVAAEIGEGAQRVAIRDAFAQFAEVLTLDPH
jgi:hypothetical protein